MYGYVWLCVAMYGYVLYGYVLLCMAMCGYLCLYGFLFVYGFTFVYGCVFMAIPLWYSWITPYTFSGLFGVVQSDSNERIHRFSTLLMF